MSRTVQAVPSRSFDEIQVGETAKLTRTITREMVARFAEFSGDHNPLHVDAGYAATTRFAEPVAHGMILASFVSTLIGMHLPGAGALWTQHSFRWPRPVFAGDTVEVEVRVAHKSAAVRSVSIDTEARNQRGERVLQGKGTVLVLDAGAEPEAGSGNRRESRRNGKRRLGEAAAGGSHDR